jgi:hypothetical protein
MNIPKKAILACRLFRSVAMPSRQRRGVDKKSARCAARKIASQETNKKQ